MKHLRSRKKYRADCEIEQRDLPILAGYFDDVELYLDAFELEPHEKGDVKRAIGIQVGMNRCLGYWRKSNPTAATFGALQDILLKLGKVEIASRVIEYLVKNRTS